MVDHIPALNRPVLAAASSMHKLTCRRPSISAARSMHPGHASRLSIPRSRQARSVVLAFDAAGSYTVMMCLTTGSVMRCGCATPLRATASVSPSSVTNKTNDKFGLIDERCYGMYFMWRSAGRALARRVERSAVATGFGTVCSKSSTCASSQASYPSWFPLTSDVTVWTNPTSRDPQPLHTSTYPLSPPSSGFPDHIRRLRNMGKLQVQNPVPSDIVIAQATVPTHITEIAQSIGLSPQEYDLYGTTKAKVALLALCASTMLALHWASMHDVSLQVKLNILSKCASSSNGHYGKQSNLRLCRAASTSSEISAG